jgi:hypothetical protein
MWLRLWKIKEMGEHLPSLFQQPHKRVDKGEAVTLLSVEKTK